MKDKEKEKFTKAWIKSAQEDLDVAEDLFKNKRYSYSLFFCHLALEKILKANYIDKKDDAPPVSHDLEYLSRKCGLNISKSETEQLKEITTFNIEARYDVIKEKLYKKATLAFSKEYLGITKILFDKFNGELK